jgi:hypothetical protein
MTKGYPTYKGLPVISGSLSLSSLRVFINNIRSSLPFTFDHAIGFYKFNFYICILFPI